MLKYMSMPFRIANVVILFLNPVSPVSGFSRPVQWPNVYFGHLTKMDGQGLPQNIGRKRIGTGSKTSRIGVCRGSSGGVTGYQFGIVASVRKNILVSRHRHIVMNAVTRCYGRTKMF